MKVQALVMVMLLAGCAALEPMAVDGVLRDAVAVSRAPAAEQKAALARAQQAFLSESTPLNRLRLATFLAALPAPLRDDARAAGLLEPVADTRDPGIGRYAAFLLIQIAERQRLVREIERIAKERASSEREHQNADKERDKREEALRQQLDALRAIERGILEREERMRKKPGAKP